MSHLKIRASATNAIKRYLRASENREGELDSERMSTYMQLLNEQWRRFEDAQDAIEQSCGEDAFPIEEEQRVQTETWYIQALSNFKRLYPKPVTPASSPASPAVATIRLPQMNLPEFNGSAMDWIGFRDVFQSLIHTNETLAESQKLQFLKSCLKGEAYKVVDRFPISDANYAEAWKLLEERYNLVRIIIGQHLAAIMDLKKAANDSAVDIRCVIDNATQHIHALKALGRPVESWDDWLVHVIVTKLALETRKQWELSLEGNEPASLEDLQMFLQARCRSLETLNPTKSAATKAAKVLFAERGSGVPERDSAHTEKNYYCLYCSENHRIYACPSFSQLAHTDKKIFVAEKRACFNCMTVGHKRSSCRSRSTCRVCNLRHHTLLHPPEPEVATYDTGNAEYSDTQMPETLTNHHMTTSNTILLATARARVLDESGGWQPIRVLLDNGSSASIITEECVQRIGIARRRSSVTITGIGDKSGGKSHGEVQLILSPRQNTQQIAITALIIPKITNELPSSEVSNRAWAHVKDLDLADPLYMKPSTIDLLIGMDEMEKCIHNEIKIGCSGTPLAQSTVFGWVLAGRTNAEETEPRRTVLCCDHQLTRDVAQLWDLEQFPAKRHLSPEELECERHFLETFQRGKDGRFIVKLPFKEHIKLGESRFTAERSFIRLERRLLLSKEMREQYNTFMQELLDLGHMEEVSDISTHGYYLPHHAVLKNTSTTTKLRVVFNASMKTASGYSLNDALLTGPQLQQDLFNILVRFRSHRFVMNADIEKMYRQVLVDKDHVDYQRILWRSDAASKLKTFRMLRVTYGVTSASYLAVKSMQQLAMENSERYKVAAETVINDFYMDDLLTGASTSHDLAQLQMHISNILKQGGFTLRKWASNSVKLNHNLQTTSHDISHFLADAGDVRTLGLVWNTQYDLLSYTVRLNELSLPLTKRRFLADASSLFDPLGLLAPATINSKIWFQELWQLDIKWDDAVPQSLEKEWTKHRESLKQISVLKIDRWCGFDRNLVNAELHVFADASEKAYAAALYARIFKNSTVEVKLIASKARVAPLKKQTLPRLELCAAHLAAKLFTQVANSLEGWTFKKFAWTDSTVTLAWLHGHPSRWSTFVANRVAAIQEVLPAESWAHVTSDHNPADCASRGISPEELVKHKMWWRGPEFLWQPIDENLHKCNVVPETSLEIRRNNRGAFLVNINGNWELLTKYSSYDKLKRITALMLRFLHNCKTPCLEHLQGAVTCAEIKKAELCLIRYTQNLYFSNEISTCRKGEPISLKSRLKRLQPFLDETNVLRVGGRLRLLEATTDVKYPIILPQEAPLARLIIHQTHIFGLHAGPQMMQAILQRKFWILRSRNLIRKMYRSCSKCKVLNRMPLQQRMADLPACRLTFARCFLQSAVDCAGPFLYKFSAGRGAKSVKGYICSFICMGSGAMHLELISDMSSAAFINALKRFINRRGLCRHLFCDNGTNFVGAEKQIKKQFNDALKDDQCARFYADSNIIWHFNPPNAPHMGGYWETGIKRIKYHLKRVLVNRLLTFEEYSTLLTDIEACVNSRPLCVHAADATDLEVLTPGHLLIGEPLKCLPTTEAVEFKGSLIDRWRFISQLRKHFWQRWREEYIVNLQKRTKWLRPAKNLKENDVVAILGERAPPAKWNLGRVVRPLPGKDGLVRTVVLKTANGECLRPIHKLCLLPTEADIFSV